MPETVKVNPRKVMEKLAAKLDNSDEELVFAQNMASAILPDSKNHCAITLSSLLIFNRLYPVGIYEGRVNLEPGAIPLAKKLMKRGWKKTLVKDIPNKPFVAGDVGVVDDGKGTHHIYLVIDATDQKHPKVADNQAPPHSRPVAGGHMEGIKNAATPTSYFLRAPDIEEEIKLMEQIVA